MLCVMMCPIVLSVNILSLQQLARVGSFFPVINKINNYTLSRLEDKYSTTPKLCNNTSECTLSLLMLLFLIAAFAVCVCVCVCV
jgi:hypothetical protein